MNSSQIPFVNNDIFDRVLSEVLFALLVGEWVSYAGMGTSAKEKAPLSKGAVACLQSFDFVDGKSCLCRDYIQRNFGVTEPLGHGLLLFQRFGLCLFKALLLAFMKFVFQSHILVPRESVGFEIRHLFVDGFGFVRVHVLGCKVLHVGLYDRVVKLLIPRKNIKIFISEVVQANVCVLFSPVFKVVNRKSIAKLPTGYKRLSYSRQKMSNIVCSNQHLNNLFEYSKAA